MTHTHQVTVQLNGRTIEPRIEYSHTSYRNRYSSAYPSIKSASSVYPAYPMNSSIPGPYIQSYINLPNRSYMY